MLFNPKWQKTADNCEVTLRGFSDWVEAQNPKGRYHYPIKAQCAVGRWLKATDHAMLLRAHWGFPSVLYKLDYVAAHAPHTFGALAKRLRAVADTVERPF